MIAASGHVGPCGGEHIDAQRVVQQRAGSSLIRHLAASQRRSAAADARSRGWRIYSCPTSIDSDGAQALMTPVASADAVPSLDPHVVLDGLHPRYPRATSMALLMFA
jgi:hypothetical protein